MSSDSRGEKVPAVGFELPDIIKVAAWMIVAALIIVALRVGQDVLVPLVIAFLIGFALNPLVTAMTRKGLPRLLSVITVMLLIGTLLAALGALLTTQLRTLSDQLPVYQNTIREKIEDLGQTLRGPGMFDGALQTVDTVASKVTETIREGEQAPPTQRVEIAEPASAPLKTAIEWLSAALAPLATTGIVVVFVFLVLLDRGDLRDRLIRLLGGNLHRSTDAMEDAGKRVSRYLLMQLLVNVAYGVPMALGLLLIGVPGWLLWGTLAALMRFIPYVGPMLSAMFPLALAFAVDPGWNMVLWTIALILTLEVISNNVIEPLLYGSSTGLSGMALIAAAIFWTALWGPAGLILSTPLTVCLLVIGRNHPPLRFLDTLLGSTPVLDVPTRIYQRLIADDPDEAIDIANSVLRDGRINAFYNDYGIEVLRRASDDYLHTARAEHRLRIANGMDVLLDTLRETHPGQGNDMAPPRIACLGGKWQIDSIACDMMAHALVQEGLAVTCRREGVLTSRHVDQLDLEGIDILCLSFFSRTPEAAAKAFCRRLRQRWSGKPIILVLWNASDRLLSADRIASMGADQAASSFNEAVHRLLRMATPQQADERQRVKAPDNEIERIQALHSTGVLRGQAREEFDALARRAADVFDVGFAAVLVVDADEELVMGQSKALPGCRLCEETGLPMLPRQDGMGAHVVSQGSALVIEDTQRDPRFTEHPTIRRWQTRFFAGLPLTTNTQLVLGALCLFDRQPRTFTPDELALLGTMAAEVVSVLTGSEAPEPTPVESANPSSASVGQIVPK